MSTTQEKPVNNAPAKAESSNPIVKVGQMVNGFIHKGTLHLPADYSPENALKSAWLLLQDIKDWDGKPALTVCTQESIVNALLDMIVQGLNPMKKQCYFIVYGKNLTCQRSYFGDQALAQRLQPGIEIYSGVVYDGDVFEYEVLRGRTVVTSHRTKLENQKVDKIVAAYCGIVDKATGEDLGTEVMTIDQIKRSWNQGQTKGKSQAHEGFPDQMALRTVIRRRCKTVINSASDELLLESIRRQEIDDTVAETDEEIALNANGQTLALSAPEQAQQVTPQQEPAPATNLEEVAAATPQPATDEGGPGF